METPVLNKVIVTEVKENQFGKLQATLKYSTSSLTVDNSRDQLYSVAELGKTAYISNRIDWIEVPAGATVESVQADLDKHPLARIARKISSKPILSNVQEQVLFNGLSGEAFEDFKKVNGIEAEAWNQDCANIMFAKIKDQQIVRYGEGNTEGKPADEPVLYNGQIQYRITRLSLKGEPDIDKRDGVAKHISLEIADNPAYVAPEVKA